MTAQTEERATVLIVEDERPIRRGLYWALADDYDVLEAESRPEALEQLRGHKIDVVLCDLHLPPKGSEISEGLAIIDAAHAERPPVPVIVITGADTKRGGLEAIKRGAYGFFEKPFDETEVAHIVRQAARVRRLEEENLRLRAESASAQRRGFARLVGGSAALECLVKRARAAATTDATIMLTGENGTGKEVLARAIYEESGRADKAFVAVSCGALPETLIESELFGHEKGAFTGAHAARKGRFEVADGGTLFLDEISEISPAVQVKLLRVLQERAFERVGGNRTLFVDIRLIAATNRDLEQEVEAGRFRRDLFYRLHVVPLRLPPLRERREDIPALAAHFAANLAEKHKRPLPELETALIEALQEYDWPGNVRELENLIEQLVVLTAGPRLGLEFLPEKMLRVLPGTVAHAADETTLEGAMTAIKRRMIVAAVQQEGGNKAAAAKRLGISRSYLHRLIIELNITNL